MTDLARKGSVTQADFVPAPDAGVWLWQIYDPGAMQSPTPQLPPVGTPMRDRMLAATLDLEDMWASAVSKAVTKIAVRGFEISDKDDSTRRVERAQELIINFDGPAEYQGGMAKVVQDFLLTDNGWFVEVVRASKDPAARVTALYHLDSFRCWRTGNLDYPVLYMDSENTWHKLARHQVIFGSDLPSPRRERYNRGRSAASRAFQTIVKLSAVETYFREKITGSRALALYFISGLSRTQLKQAIETSDAEQARKGLVVYKGAVMVPIEQEGAIQVASIDLAGVPDGFAVETERDAGWLTYTNAIGMSAQSIKPLSGQGLGTGTQTTILDDAEEGEGLAFFSKDWEFKANHLIMPKSTTYTLRTRDVRDRKAEAELENLKAQKIVTLLGNPATGGGVITQQMALQLAVDAGIIPAEFIPEDVTPAGVMTDSGDQSKPAGLALPAAFALPTPATPAPALPGAQSHVFFHPQQGAIKAAPQFAVGDRVQVVGTPHMPGQTTGTIMLVNGPAYGILFDGDEDVHKWYAGDELAAIGTKAADETDALIDDGWAEAVKWASDASGSEQAS